MGCGKQVRGFRNRFCPSDDVQISRVADVNRSLDQNVREYAGAGR